MDVNGTRFHLLLNKDDWTVSSTITVSGSPSEPDLVWNEKSSYLRLKSLLFHFPKPPGDPSFQPEHRRGAARDQYANWYWIDEKQSEIRSLAMNSDQSEHFWSSDDMGEACIEEYHRDFKPMHTATPPILKLGALTVTTHHYLVVGAVHPAGILVFDLHAGGQPVYIHWPELKPFDMAPAQDGGVWILDRENKCYWRLDRSFRVVTIHQGEELNTHADFQPKNGSQKEKKARSLQTGITLKMALPLKVEHPLALEALSDNTILILDSNPALPYSEVHRYCSGEYMGSVSLERKLEQYLDVGDNNSDLYSLHGYDIAFVYQGENEYSRVTGTLYIIGSDGNQTYAFTFVDHGDTFSLDLKPGYFPLRLFSGKALVSDGTTVYYDLQDRWLPVIERSRPRFREQGVITTRVFDGKDIDCVWHRMFLDASIPPGAEVLLESRAANRKEFLVQMPWRTEPRLYRRSDGAELPYYQPFTFEEARQEGTGTWESLLQHGQGRYLELQITIRGTGRNTPLLRALRVYYPRFSYLKEYLPALYQDDTNSALFLERFLANMEGIYSVIEGKIEQVQTMFDVYTIQSEYLDWLAGWFGVMLDPAWDENRRRLFLSHIMQLFRERGTPAGLLHAIRLSIDPCPDDSVFEQDVFDLFFDNNDRTYNSTFAGHFVRIVEGYRTRNTPGVVYGDPSQAQGPGITTDINTWELAQGTEPIHRRYREFLKYRYNNIKTGQPDIDILNKSWLSGYHTFDDIVFPPIVPDQPEMAEDWRLFTRQRLGFTYAEVTPDDTSAYQTFLARSYQEVDRLERAGYQTVSSFNDITLPRELPSGIHPLQDWIQFVSLGLPIINEAHYFTVLIPVYPNEDMAEQERHLDLVKRIVDLEKPAHTNCDVKQYWALFRVGETRLGLDTLLGESSRYVALKLGKVALTNGFLASSHPWNVPDRTVVGGGDSQYCVKF